MLTQLTEGAKNHEVCKFTMFRVVPKREGKADSANAWHALRCIIPVLASYTASQHAAGAKHFLPSTNLYSVHCRTNSQFSDLVTFIFFFFSISLRSTWCSAEHSLGISALDCTATGICACSGLRLKHLKQSSVCRLRVFF
jgi:hypothetical protein